MDVVLFTCAGQRVDVVAAFRQAGARTVAVDMNPLAPALYHADCHVVLPPADDANYIPNIVQIVDEQEVSLIVPLADIDMSVLAERRDELGALLLLPEAEVVERTNDKYLAHLFFEEQGIASPGSWLPDELPAAPSFPVLIKPRRGFGSRNIFLARDGAELAAHLAGTPVPSFVQALCLGDEFSIDVFSDLQARCLNAIPRSMIESKGGESIKGMTVRDEELIDLGRRVAETVGVIGPATIQCFRSTSERTEVTDVNLRFGGAFPLPLAAGGGYPVLALALARGERPQVRVGAYREGVVMTRFFSELCLEAGAGEALEPIVRQPVGQMAHDD
jgi:carbamoyl-phosphate synthase large subunit